MAPRSRVRRGVSLEHKGDSTMAYENRIPGVRTGKHGDVTKCQILDKEDGLDVTFLEEGVVVVADGVTHWYPEIAIPGLAHLFASARDLASYANSLTERAIRRTSNGTSK